MASLEAGYRHVQLDAVQSTNSECFDLAAKGDAGKVWVTASEQLAGRGRRGREWVSQPGNLYASLLLIDPAPDSNLGTLPFVASLAVWEAVTAFVSDDNAPVTLKWPNDVLVGGAKVSGILLEASALGSGQKAVVIGCGINCQHKPEQTPYPAVTLSEFGRQVEPNAVFAELSKSMAHWLEVWDGGSGFQAVREAWMSQAHPLGTPLVVRYADREVHGRFGGLNATGHLLLETQTSGTKQISAADIFFA